MENIPGRSYGYPGSRMRDFDIVEFTKRPTTLARLLSILLAIVVFGCISAVNSDSQSCVFNKNADACNYGVAIGVLAFLACLVFLVIDSQFAYITNTDMRKQIVMGDMAFSGLWTFLWFVGFCFLADQWRRTEDIGMTAYQSNHARASIAFSFFSMFSWATLALMAMQRYRQGDVFQFDDQPETPPNEYQGGSYGAAPYDTYSNQQSYQQQTGQNGAPIATEYKVPDY